MTQATVGKSDVLGRALADQVFDLAELEGGVWSFALDRQGTLRAHARLAPPWAALDVDLPDGSVASAWEAAVNGSLLSGSVRLVLPTAGRLGVRAEVRVRGGTDLGEWVRASCRALRRVVRALASGRLRATAAQSAPKDRDGLEALCAEAGWPCSTRSGGCVSVRLDVPDSVCEARLHSRGAHGLDVVAAITEWDARALSGASRNAIALVLLGVAGATRLVHARAAGDGNRERAGLAIPLAASPCAAELAEALSVLSVACDMCRREVLLLQDEAIAREYVAARERRQGTAVIQQTAKGSAYEH